MQTTKSKILEKKQIEESLKKEELKSQKELRERVNKFKMYKDQLEKQINQKQDIVFMSEEERKINKDLLSPN